MCILHKWELFGVFYEEYSPKMSNYGVRVIEVYKCFECGKEKFKRTDKLEAIYSSTISEKITSLKSKGVKDIMIYKVNNIKW